MYSGVERYRAEGRSCERRENLKTPFHFAQDGVRSQEFDAGEPSFRVFAHTRESSASLGEFFGKDVHDLETEMMLLAEQVEQALARHKYEVDIVDDFGGEAVGGIGKGGGKAEQRTRPQVSPGEGRKISLKAEAHGAVHDEEDAGDGITAAEETIPTKQMKRIADCTQVRAKFIGRP
jgi:hypothetical protein